ncbi:hypothetical protein [Paracoccus sp. (in: a-proteobacteria)]|uniref:hypothetical protein n=1 Tax=Paracoccus sp. TaxID=267 RepID=UPI002AFE1C60|nr:hypothetical protein [Paracoccus sp. (in: a-proteobacteria)]
MIAVWFSNGAPSAVALKMTVEKYGADQVRAVNNPVAEEDEDNLRFGREVAEWCGIEIEHFRASKYPAASAVEVWDRRGAMSFPRGAPCTTHLKKEARQEWERQNCVDWHVFGFTAEEKARHDRFVLTERENVLPVLIDAGMTRAMCAARLRSSGIRLPRVYEWGLPNANCLGCVKATSPTYWNLIRKAAPDVFRQRSEQSRRLGAKLVRVNNRRIFLDELDPRAMGRPLKTMPDCGLFCEERKAPVMGEKYAAE